MYFLFKGMLGIFPVFGGVQFHIVAPNLENDCLVYPVLKI